MNILEFYPKLSDKKIPLSALEITPRVFHNWKEEKVIDYYEEIESNDIGVTGKTKKRKWVLLNAFDAIWLLIVKDLRKLNLDLNTIVKLKEYLYRPYPMEKLLETYTDEQIQQLFATAFKNKTTSPIDFTTITKADYIAAFKNEELNLNFYMKNITQLFVSVLLLEDHPSIILYKEDDEINFFILNRVAQLKLNDRADFLEFIMPLFSYYAMNIPVIEAFTKLFKDVKLEQYCNHYGLFSENEKLILDIFREDNFKEITIFKDNNENLTITTTQSIEVKNELAIELRKILGLKQYEKAEIVYRNDKHLVINKTKKTKNSPD